MTRPVPSEAERERVIGLAHALNLAADETRRAIGKFPPFNSAHEGLAVIEEEFLELREKVFWGEKQSNSREGWRFDMAAEATQLAAMALRFLVDVCGVKDS